MCKLPLKYHSQTRSRKQIFTTVERQSNDGQTTVRYNICPLTNPYRHPLFYPKKHLNLCHKFSHLLPLMKFMENPMVVAAAISISPNEPAKPSTANA